MAEQITGVVTKITESKTARGTFYGIIINDDRFGFGNETPEFGEGSEVTFEVEVNGNFENVDQDTFKVLELVEAKASGRSGGRSGGRNGGRDGGRGGDNSARGGSRNGSRNDDKPAHGSRGGSKPAAAADKPAVDWDLKDEKIQWQAARNSALALATLAVNTEALKLPAKQADKLEALEAYVSLKTEEFFLDVKGTKWKDL